MEVGKGLVGKVSIFRSREAGKVGRRLVKQLVGRGHEAIAQHRNPEPERS